MGKNNGNCSIPTLFLFHITFYGFFIDFLAETNRNA